MGFRRTLIALPLFVCALSGCAVGLNDNDIVMVGCADVHTLVDRASKPGKERVLALVDPRSPEEFQKGHLPGAINVGPIQHGQKPDKVIRSARNVVVYGQDPGDALARGMTKRLMEAGIGGVRLFPGGLREWTLRHLPIEPEGANPFPEEEQPAPATEPAATPDRAK